MSLPSKNVIFNILNSTAQHPKPDLQLQLFNSPDTQSADTEFWYYSDLYNLYGDTYMPIKPDFGHKVWQKLQIPTPQSRGNKITFRPTDIKFYNQHVATVHHDYNLGATEHKNAPDLKLTRYGVWCLSRPSPYMMFTRTYLISPVMDITPTFQNIHNASYQFSRIHLRNELTQYEKILGGLLHKYHGDFKLFNHHMTRAFFYGYGARDLKEIHRIPIKDNDPLANYMGAASLHARTTALRNTVQRFDDNQKHDLDILYNILHQELTAQRIRTIQKYNIRPEQDIFQQSISAVQSDLNKCEYEFVKKYANQKIR